MPANTRDSADPLLPGPFQHTTATTSNDPTSFDDDQYEPSAPNPLDKMGISYSTAKWLAPASFLFDFALQNYGMMSSPNMKEIHDRSPAAFAPQPFGILGFFGPQQIFQLIWLRELFRREDQVERGTLRYVPWYALGNVMIGVWMFLWNSENLKGSNIPVAINTLTQLYYVFFLRNPQPSTYQSKLTNIINITFAGVGVLDLFHNTSAGYFKGIPPNTLVKVATSLAAPLTALVSPLLFGSCVAYDLFIVALGQHQLAQKALNGLGGGGGEGWAKLLGGVGLATLGVVGARAYQGARWV